MPRSTLLASLLVAALAVTLAPTRAAAKPKAAPAAKPAKATRCQPRDEFVPIAHGDGGGVWIPKEIACGGRAPLLIMLHGNNSDRTSHVSIGGGRALDDLARELIGDRRARPVLLAEPVHYRVCGTGLFNEAFDFRSYRAKLEQALAARHIRVQSYSVAGHSGAGCCGGVYRAAEAFGPLKLLGLIDTCYGSSVFSRSVHEYFDGRGTIVVNASRGEPGYPHYREFEQEVLGARPIAVHCNNEVYRRCLKHARRPYYSYTTTRTEGSYHGGIPTDFYRTVLTRFFPHDRRHPPKVAGRAAPGLRPAAPPAERHERPRSARTSQ
jgi:hypothetical protein